MTQNAAMLILAGAVALSGSGDEKHQRGNIPILEGHEVHMYEILIREPLAAGHHNLGTLRLDKLGEVQVSVEIGKDGSVSKITTGWPSQVKPEVVSDTTHDVFFASPGQALKKKGKSKCQNIHAGGSCDGCSTYNWLIVTQLQPQ
jgi:hypothetical protein